MEKINTIGKEFSLFDLIKFTTASVVSKLFISLLSTLDDSLFISRYVGPNALAAFTIALPWFMLVDAIGMLLYAVSTKSSILMGEKKNDEANDCFTTMLVIAGCVGLVFTLILTFFKKPILTFLGATDILYPYMDEYMKISRFYTPLVFITNIFAKYYIVAGKPKFAVFTTVVQTICNFFFDWLFMVQLRTGIIGTAYANLISNVTLTIIGIIFFCDKNKEVHFSKLLEKPFKLLAETFKLGRSQSLTSLAVSLNTLICNAVLLANGGEDFVAAFTIVNNVQFMLMNAFFGFLGATSPIVSYAYGEKNAKKLSNTLKRCTLLIECLSVLLGLIVFTCKKPILLLFFGDNVNSFVASTAAYGLSIVPFNYPIFSFNVLVQEYAVAVANYKASTKLSIIENVIFANIVVIALPLIFGRDSVWFTFLVSECLTLTFSLFAVYNNKDVYGYGKDEIASFIN